MSSIQVWLLVDHAILRSGPRALLNIYPDVEAGGETSNGQEAIRRGPVDQGNL